MDKEKQAGSLLGGAKLGAQEDIAVQASLIQEELVRQIADADRWSAVREAWEALLKVKIMSQSLIEERNHLGQKIKGNRGIE